MYYQPARPVGAHVSTRRQYKNGNAHAFGPICGHGFWIRNRRHRPRRPGVVGGGLYEIINRNSGLALGINGGLYSHGSAVDQETYTASSDQLWYFEAGPSGSYVIRNFQSKQALEVGGNSTSNGGTVDQWIPLNQPNQQWTLSVA